MLENYSVRAQRVVSLAMIEARGLDHSQVGTEHLLLGLLSDEDGLPAETLRAAGASLSAARHKVAEAAGPNAVAPNTETLPLTPRAQRALGRAGRFSRQDREREVTAQHVLLGVLDVEGLACQVLRGLGVDIAQLRDGIVTRHGEVADPILDEQGSAARPRCPRCRVTLDDTMAVVTMAARHEGVALTDVNVVYCAACGTTLGVVRPESS